MLHIVYMRTFFFPILYGQVLFSFSLKKDYNNNVFNLILYSAFSID